MSVKVGLEETYPNGYNGILQGYSRPVKALLMYSQRRNSVIENESFNQKLPSSQSWSNEGASQNIQLKLTCKKTYLKETSTWSDLQYEAEGTVRKTKYFPPKKRFLEKAEMEADQTNTIDCSLPSRYRTPRKNYNHLGVSTKGLKATILRYQNAFEVESKKPNTNASEFLSPFIHDIAKNNNLEAEKNLNLCVQNAQDQKTEPYYRSGYKKFTLRRIEEDSSNDSNATDPTTAVKQLPDNMSELKKINGPRGERNRACKGVRYQQFMNDTLTKRQNKKLRPKKLSETTEEKRLQGKKRHLKEGKHQATEVNALPTQSRRETRNSVKIAALQKQKEESSEEPIENNKRKLISVDTSKDLDSTSTMLLPKKRFKTSEYDNKCEVTEELKRLSSPSSPETSSVRLSSPESTCSSNSSIHVHYKKRVSRTFTESQRSLINLTSESNVNLQTLADVALRDFPY